jgi:hypothetical protein
MRAKKNSKMKGQTGNRQHKKRNRAGNSNPGENKRSRGGPEQSSFSPRMTNS